MLLIEIPATFSLVLATTTIVHAKGEQKVVYLTKKNTASLDTCFHLKQYEIVKTLRR
jgi:hypothetical protein